MVPFFSVSGKKSWDFRVQSINQSNFITVSPVYVTYRQLKRVYETLPKINEAKLRGKSEHREELESERGHDIVGVPADRQAFPWHPSRSTRRQTTQRQAFPWHPSQSTRRQTTQRQAFPWHPSRSTRRQATHRQTSLPLAPLSEHQETGYTQTD